MQVLKGDIKPAIETHEMLYQVIQRHNFLPEAFTTDFQVNIHKVYFAIIKLCHYLIIDKYILFNYSTVLLSLVIRITITLFSPTYLCSCADNFVNGLFFLLGFALLSLIACNMHFYTFIYGVLPFHFVFLF